MNTLLIGKQFSIMCVVMGVVGMALLGTQVTTTVDAAPRALTFPLAVETDVPIEDRATLQQARCEDAGGMSETHYVLDESGISSAKVICTGGDQDGRVCYNTRTTVECASPGRFEQHAGSVLPEQRPDIAAPAENPQDTPSIVHDPVAQPVEVVEDSTGGDTVVVVYQSDLSVGDKTKGQKALCEGLGGKATPVEDSGPDVSVVKCTGGLLRGMTCFNSEDATNCIFRSSVTPEESRLTPAAGVEAPVVDAPTATASATEAQPTPTATPTVAPTATAKVIVEVTVTSPSDPPPPKNDNSVPPGGSIEDPTQNEPTPAGAPLL